MSLALAFLALITLANLRGLRETGTLMSIPVYLFLFSYIPMLLYGIIRFWIEGPVPLVAVAPPASHPLTVFLVLRAFATGCTALTGIEAISNGVPVFRNPEAKNAAKTLIAMALLMGVLFLGSIGLTQFLGIIANQQETILSALARRLLGSSFVYYLIQLSTMMILAVAANTSFAGFPRLAAILAADGYLPRQLTGLGDRLVFTNGITSLAVATGVMIVFFKGDTHALIPLFAVGVFLAFTLSQAGMVVHWLRERGRGWQLKTLANGIGALATLITLLVVAFSKFLEGAWLTVLLIPSLVFIFYKIHHHYREVVEELSLRGLPPSLKPTPPVRVVIPISGVHRGMIDTVGFAQAISSSVTAVYVELEAGAGEAVRETWQRWWPDVPLVIVPSPYRSIIQPLINFLDETDRQHNDGHLATVILPEFIPVKGWQGLLHNQTAWLLKAALLYHRTHLGAQRRVIIDVPYHLKR